MMELKSLVFLVSICSAAANSQRPHFAVYGRYMKNQILPCTFQTGDDPLVHWLKNDAVVHSYYYGKDQFDHQVLQFRGRTSLFHDELSRGNASLLLKKVEIADRGLYKCYTSTSEGRQDSLLNLEVEAPVTKVSINQEDGIITCSSEGIYPKPQVTWSRKTTGDTRIDQTEHQLYNIRSSVRVDDEGDYTCNISNTRSWRAATLTIAGSIILSGADEMLDCPALKSPLTSVTWRFNDKLLVQREDHLIIPVRWRDHVKDLSVSGSLSLQDLSPCLSGMYTCEVTSKEETCVKIIKVTIPGERHHWVLLAVLMIFSLILHNVLCCFWKGRKAKSSGRSLTSTMY